MRILLIADVHGNWPALQAAAAEPHDVCLFLGDLVDYFLDPAPCVTWVREKAKYGVRGNHDHGAAQNVTVTGRTGYKYLTGLTRPLTRDRLPEPDLRYLSRLPLTRMATLENTRFFLVHATPRDPLDEFAPPDADFWSRRLEDVDADVICVGHTHQPYVLEVGDKLVVNPGSVGLSRDGDPRASYAILEDYKVELKRVEYAVEEAAAVIQASALPEAAKEMLVHIARTGAPANGKPEQDGQNSNGKVEG
ncbi:MAG TPA: YfcE family phosphodiesterase [Gemmataceae bacterium]|nr:YfcE family phosphodiesterase [Gemmataceae bacterium]